MSRKPVNGSALRNDAARKAIADTVTGDCRYRTAPVERIAAATIVYEPGVSPFIGRATLNAPVASVTVVTLGVESSVLPA